ncbi:unnamed protein product [Symbiodinium sp. CCMP2592]|nr:unnamed protein product [Symbiodinium sp. CCMP2592]
MRSYVRSCAVSAGICCLKSSMNARNLRQLLAGEAGVCWDDARLCWHPLADQRQRVPPQSLEHSTIPLKVVQWDPAAVLLACLDSADSQLLGASSPTAASVRESATCAENTQSSLERVAASTFGARRFPCPWARAFRVYVFQSHA